mgnify:CR=1 FL=1
MLKYRADYQPPSCKVVSAGLDISIFDTRALVTTTLELQRVSDAPFILNGRDLTLHEISINGRILDEADWPVVPEGLSFSDLPKNCVLRVRSECHPQSNTSLDGLYLSGGMYCTQCEPEGFRRMAFFPDRPDVMTVFTVRIEADKAFPQLLSNGNLVETGEVDADRHYALWHDPHPKPSYLFACVVGDLDLAADSFTTASGRTVDLHIYVEKDNVSLTGHAMDSLKRSMKWDEDTYGLEYDLDLFQIVAVSHFNMGAMENKGLNIFNSKFVLADPQTATDEDLDRVESIVAHEYFHNWTGNRVTCRDWFQLTLKEGLTVYRDQCFSADMHDEGVQRASDVSLLRAAQFPEDRSPTAHPIRPESYREINNFYTPTVYEKGAEVIRMMAGFLGRDGFRRGMDLYFERHDGSAVTCDDFVAALADANDCDMSGFQRWYSQAGTPRLHVKRQQQTATGGTSSTTADITLANQSVLTSNIATTPETLGQYIGVDGFISESTRLVQDSKIYQDYSYIVKVGEGITSWRNDVKRSIHPAGFNLLGQVDIATRVSATLTGGRTLISGATETDAVVDLFRIIFDEKIGRKLGTTTDGSTLRSNPERTIQSAASFTANTRAVTLTQDITLSPGQEVEGTVNGVELKQGFVYAGPRLSSINKFAFSAFSHVPADFELDGTDGSSTNAGDNILLEDVLGNRKMIQEDGATDASSGVQISTINNIKLGGSYNTDIDGEAVDLADYPLKFRTNFAIPAQVNLK